MLVFVDDDNVLAPDYLETALCVARERPFLGAWSGQCLPCFDETPAPWTERYWGTLCIRRFETELWSNLPRLADTMPAGAGLCVRRAVAQRYLDLHDGGATSLPARPHRRLADLRRRQRPGRLRLRPWDGHGADAGPEARAPDPAAAADGRLHRTAGRRDRVLGRGAGRRAAASPERRAAGSDGRRTLCGSPGCVRRTIASSPPSTADGSAPRASLRVRPPRRSGLMASAQTAAAPRAAADGAAGDAPAPGPRAALLRALAADTRFTVVSNNCWGAHIYQALGVPYATPFVGLFIPPADYLELRRESRCAGGRRAQLRAREPLGQRQRVADARAARLPDRAAGRARGDRLPALSQRGRGARGVAAALRADQPGSRPGVLQVRRPRGRDRRADRGVRGAGRAQQGMLHRPAATRRPQSRARRSEARIMRSTASRWRTSRAATSIPCAGSAPCPAGCRCPRSYDAEGAARGRRAWTAGRSRPGCCS